MPVYIHDRVMEPGAIVLCMHGIALFPSTRFQRHGLFLFLNEKLKMKNEKLGNR